MLSTDNILRQMAEIIYERSRDADADELGRAMHARLSVGHGRAPASYSLDNCKAAARALIAERLAARFGEL